MLFENSSSLTDCIIERFEESLLVNGLSLNTISSYRADIFKLCAFFEKKNILNLSQTQISFCITNLLKISSSSTVLRFISSLKRFYHYCSATGYCKNNPLIGIELPRKNFFLPYVLSCEEVKQMFCCLEKDQTLFGLRNRLIVELLYATGVRVSELIQFRLATFLYASSEDVFAFNVCGKRNKMRKVFIFNHLLDLVKEYIKLSYLPQNIFLFSHGKSHITRQRVDQILKNISKKINIRLSAHILRHTFATHLLRGGANLIEIQKILGHSDIVTTQIYTKVDTQDLIQNMKKYHPLFLH